MSGSLSSHDDGSNQNVKTRLNPTINILISHLLLIFISYRSSGEKLIKFQGNSFCVIMSTIHMAPLRVTNFLLLRSSMEEVKIRRRIFLWELGYSPEKMNFPSIDRGPNERDRVLKNPSSFLFQFYTPSSLRLF